ncbi:MAG: pentapeptide repeat-containing protein [Rhodospirillales bacterium]|nr:pentapeptide repeat-containing protein [Rhodospirillales bacterium]
MADEEDLSRIIRGEKDHHSSDLSGADLSGRSLRNCDFTNARLERVNFQSADLEGSIFVKSKIAHANFSGANLSGAVFGQIPCSFANFSGADLREADFKRAHLTKSDFSRADLRGTDFSQAKFQDEVVLGSVIIDASTKFDDAEVLRPLSRLPTFIFYNYERGKLVRREKNEEENWSPDSVAAYREAEQRISNAFKRKDTVLDLSNLDALERLPPEITRLVQLQNLYFAGTQITDLTPLARLKDLNDLGFPRTQVIDLAPLAGLANLQGLNFSSTMVTDLDPLSGLSKLRRLSVSRTLVADLSPLAGLSKLEEGARKSGGLFFSDCLNITDPVLIELSKKHNPERTIETLRYLREQLKTSSDLESVPNAEDSKNLDILAKAAEPLLAILEDEEVQAPLRPARQIIVLQIDTLVQALSENVEAATTRRNEPPAFDLALGSDAAFLEEIRRLIAALQDLKGAVDLPDTQAEKQKSSLAKDALREFVMKMAGSSGTVLGNWGTKLALGMVAIQILASFGIGVDGLKKTLLESVLK